MVGFVASDKRVNPIEMRIRKEPELTPRSTVKSFLKQSDSEVFYLKLYTPVEWDLL